MIQKACFIPFKSLLFVSAYKSLLLKHLSVCAIHRNNAYESPSMHLVDYHVHTSLCNHAEGGMEAYVRRAEELGLAEIAFLDHLTLRESGHENSMSEQEVGLYHSAIMRLKRKYAGRIMVRAGLEVDHDPENRARAIGLLERFSFDIITASVHFSDDYNFVSRRAARKGMEVPDEAWADSYFHSLRQMLDEPFFDVVGHVDVFKKFGRKPTPAHLERFGEIFKRMAGLGLVMELNTSGSDHPAGEPYPGPHLLTMAAQEGVAVTLGSDAHAPREVGRHFGAAVRLLRETGHMNIVLFRGRKKRLAPLPACPVEVS